MEDIIAPAMPRCWNKASKPHKFCPGCGHGIILKALGDAVDDLNLRDRILFGCDIGCSLLAWDFFDFDTVQTHHGRTVPVITGAKRANDDIVGIAYMGDGGAYAIGSQHLFNAAVRNEKILTVVCNNSNYGMTGGQMSPTTLPGMKTETSPYGRDPASTGSPTKGPEMVAAVAPEGAFVARGTVANYRQLKGFLKKGLENQLAGRGISFVEVLSGCPTNWRTNAGQTWQLIEKEMTRYFTVGELKTPPAEEA